MYGFQRAGSLGKKVQDSNRMDSEMVSSQIVRALFPLWNTLECTQSIQYLTGVGGEVHNHPAAGSDRQEAVQEEEQPANEDFLMSFCN